MLFSEISVFVFLALPYLLFNSAWSIFKRFCMTCLPKHLLFKITAHMQDLCNAVVMPKRHIKDFVKYLRQISVFCFRIIVHIYFQKLLPYRCLHPKYVPVHILILCFCEVCIENSYFSKLPDTFHHIMFHQTYHLLKSFPNF